LKSEPIFSDRFVPLRAKYEEITFPLKSTYEIQLEK